MADVSGGARVIGGRYALGPLLGAGGMGVVHEAQDTQLSRTVALKLLPPEREASTRAEQRFEREALAAARVGHPNIVRVLDFGRDEQGLFLVMEHLSGETLKERIARSGPLSVTLALSVHLQLLDALSAAHAGGILHRDVKPSNVFLTELADGSVLVKLLDFGIAALAEDEQAQHRLTATGVALGSPAYMAPERLDGVEADARADVYSVGVCLYESLVGVAPSRFDLPSQNVRVLVERRPDLPFALSAAVARATARDPDARFASVDAMSDALREALHEPSRASMPRALRTDTTAGTGETRPEPPRREPSASPVPPVPVSPEVVAARVEQSAVPVTPPITAPPPSRWRGLLVGLLLGAGMAGLAAWMIGPLGGEPDAPTLAVPPQPVELPSNALKAPLPPPSVVAAEPLPPPVLPDAPSAPASRPSAPPTPVRAARPRAPSRPPEDAPPEATRDLTDTRHELLRPPFRAH
jgi:serine/threonine-protein kinase